MCSQNAEYILNEYYLIQKLTQVSHKSFQWSISKCNRGRRREVTGAK